MKTNEAPEKIILSADRETGILYNEWVVKDLTDSIKIEYIRKDAFIEKACKWIKDNGSHYIDIVNGQLVLKKGIIKDFKNYMKGE